jgi:AMP phosphorylase
MKLKVKNFKWLAGRPVVILHEDTAKRMNVFQNDRVCLSNAHKFYAVVDIFPKLVKVNEVGLSSEVTKIFRSKDGSVLDVSSGDFSPASKLIKKKIDGEDWTAEDLEIIINQIVINHLTEAEIAYFASAQKMRGMSLEESVNLTKSMIKSGVKLKFPGDKIVDKHCIGGVAGNRTTPIVVSICAAAGLTCPKTSSRAITSAAGTADVIETLSNVELKLDDLKRVVKKTGACLAWGGSLKLAPSDDKIIQVERLINLDIEAQMLASIMSKKISAGSKYILIDIPYGKGAKVTNIIKARKLGRKFKQIASFFAVKLKVVYTNGSQPVGNGVGPVLEMLDVLSVLENKENLPEDLKEKSLFLAIKLMELGGIKNSKKKAVDILESGKAYDKFKEIIHAQNGNERLYKKRLKLLKPATFSKVVKATRNGKITEINNKKINTLCRILGTPETPGAGVYLARHLGKVKKGDIIMTMYSESKHKLNSAAYYLKKEKVMKVR